MSSVYLWEAPGAWFEGAFYVQNVVEEGRWDAVHVARATGEGIGRYELTSTVYVEVGGAGSRIGGFLHHKLERECRAKGDRCHVANVGGMIEDVEIELRSKMDNMYLKKAVEVVERMRKEKGEDTLGKKHAAFLNQAILKRRTF